MESPREAESPLESPLLSPRSMLALPAPMTVGSPRSSREELPPPEPEFATPERPKGDKKKKTAPSVSDVTEQLLLTGRKTSEGRPAGAPAPKAKKAKVEHERSRSQFLVRAPGQRSKVFKYTTLAEQKRAEKDANAHLKEITG